MPDELSQQIEPLHAAIRAMGWPLILVEGVEADDVIGTLAAEAQKRGIRTIISTGDKDMAQLVTPQVTLVNTMSNETLDEAAVEKKFGVRPERFVDYLTLVGDAIDNVPGVEKVGPKTAAKWVTQHQTLDNVIANAHQVTGVIGDNLRKVVDWLPKARELLTIKCDVALQVTPEELAHEKHDLDKLAELFERFEFKTWRRELDELRHRSIIDTGGASSGSADASTTPERVPVRPQTPRDYETILTDGQLEAWLSVISAAPLVSVATVTTSLDPLTADIVGLALSVALDRAAYIPLAHTYAGAPSQLERTVVLTRLKPWFENEAAVKVGHNLKFDLHALENHGVRMRGAAHDTLLESYVIESHKPHDMDNLAERHLGIKTLTFNEVCGKGAGQICFDQVEIERATLYAAEDADVTLQLHAALYPQIERDPKLTRVYSHIEMPVMPVLQAMERNGVLLDSVMLDKQSQELGLKMMELETLAHQMAGQPFNLNSPKQIQEILFDKQKLPVIKKTPSGAPSTDEEVLQKLAEDYPLPKVLLEYRGMAKLKSTYTDKLPKMIKIGRAHV